MNRPPISAFIAQSRYPELYEKLIRFGGVSTADMRKSPRDYYAANTGSVPGLIYNSKCEAFFKNNFSDIFEVLQDAQDEGLMSDGLRHYNAAFCVRFVWEFMQAELFSFWDL